MLVEALTLCLPSIHGNSSDDDCLGRIQQKVQLENLLQDQVCILFHQLHQEVEKFKTYKREICKSIYVKTLRGGSHHPFPVPERK